MMNEQHVTEDIPAYALGILGEEEQARVGAHLSGCAACRAVRDDYDALAADLVVLLPAAAPPASLKARLRERLDADTLPAPQTRRAARPAPASPSRTGALREWLTRRPWQPALVALLLVVALGLLLRPRDVTAPAVVTLDLVGTDAAPNAYGIVVLGSHYNPRLGTLVVDNLEPLPPEQQYQLWLVKDGRISGGVFDVGDDGYGSLTVRAPDPLDSYTFGVTVEPAGGSNGPTGARVLASAP
jgi:anti-sigma-K factor RskA